MKEMPHGATVANLGPIYTIFVKVSKVVSHICFDSRSAGMQKFLQKEKCVGSQRERQDFLGKAPVTYERSQGLLKGWGYSYGQPT